MTEEGLKVNVKKIKFFRTDEKSVARKFQVPTLKKKRSASKLVFYASNETIRT